MFNRPANPFAVVLRALTEAVAMPEPPKGTQWNYGPGWRKLPKRRRNGKWITPCRRFTVPHSVSPRGHTCNSFDAERHDASHTHFEHCRKRVIRWFKHSKDVRDMPRHVREKLRLLQSVYGKKELYRMLSAVRRSGSALV